VRRFPAAAAALGLVAVALVGCSSVQSPTCERTTQPGALENLISIDGEVGEAPDVSVPTPFQADGLDYADVVTGDGTAVVASDQVLNLGITLINGETGEQILQQGYTAETSGATTLALWDQALPGLSEALMCASEGSRVVASFAADDLAAGAQIVQVGAPVVAVVDLDQVFLSAADGAEQFNQGNGLPTVVRAPGGQPGVIVPDAEAPAEVVVQVLKKGDGESVADGDAIAAHELIVDWDRTLVSTTWQEQPKGLGAATGDDPVLNALVGQTVGSQIMVVVPASDAGPAQVQVIDILGIVGSAAG
jgi:hypothetical protein